MKNNLKIPYGKKGKFKLIFFLIISITLGSVFILYPSTFSGSYVYRSEKTILLCGYFIMFGFVFLLAQYIYLFKFARCGLHITNEGIINNTNLLFSGLIKWKDIESISICEKYKNSIDVFIKNPEFYIKKTKNPIRKINMYMYYYFYKTPCVIGVQNLDIETSELLKLLQDKWGKGRCQ